MTVAPRNCANWTEHVRRTYPLTSAAEAHRDVETGHGRGKVVLLVE